MDGCCLLILNYTAPGLTARNLLLAPDPDTARSMPPGYFWPYDGSEAQGMDALKGANSAAAGPRQYRQYIQQQQYRQYRQYS